MTLIAQKFFTSNANDHFGTRGAELDAARFLLFLGLFGGCANALSVVGLNTVPAPETRSLEHSEHDHTITASSAPRENEQTPLLRDGADTTGTSHAKTPPSVSGKAFFMDFDAQSFFLVMICLAGTGLMIINSISAIVDAVAAPKVPSLLTGLGGLLDETSPVASTRAIHVALISVSSYTGRILAGFGSDIAIHRYGACRIDVVPIASVCMALAQLVAMFVPLQWLYLCSILTGLAYGGFFGVAGTIVAEMWGEETCGQNW